ncbi:dioxygenase [Lactiplantibacillus fabifermentans T30PCM01]|uniref:Dioxygenase n=1 Tax=Lactiplantibacillus fabifermentans T30PCM01 TaxID=1400520 RepID=W6T762_9LACO|nr:mannitol dehydrogenase family protein [Lactiplantibacillus fabifermentans]ETY73663.1 dioxygenase [Lactiplantibacillus fabifermentans T30PCM01]
MTTLTTDYLKNSTEFEKIGIKVPTYDQAALQTATASHPRWVHFGGGNLFRAFHAAIAQRLIEAGELDSGIIVGETYDEQVVTDVYRPRNNRILRVITKENGDFDKELIASVAAAYFVNPSAAEDWAKMQAIFQAASLQVVTFSITEKGYNLKTPAGDLNQLTLNDIENGPAKPVGNMAGLVSLLLGRFKNGAQPLTLLSTDNFSQNGDRLKDSVLTIANGWLKNGFVDQAFLDYLQDKHQISFPLSMIDRITPNPAEKVGAQLKASGFDDADIIHTAKHTNIAAFTNSEASHYLVVEDEFPNGRPHFETAGVIMTNRATVNDADQMKVTTCLNPLHTALAIFGSVLGYHSIADEMQNQDLVALIKQIGYVEGLPVVTDPKVINPKAFIDQLITKRLPNPFMPDTPQRIATDTSQKMAIRYGVTIKQYLADENRDPVTLTFIPLTIAAWLRYLLGVNDDGEAFTPSPDPMMDYLQTQVAGLTYGSQTSPQNVHVNIKNLLSNESIFGVDLYAVGLGKKIEDDLAQMLTGQGAVAKTLATVLASDAQPVA